MLSIAPIREGGGRTGVRYYLDKVANSRDDYWTGRGESPGRWLGRGAAALGLSGTVDVEAYLAVMDGRSPADGGQLLERKRTRRVCGWSLTFSAPKSLSLLWAFGEPVVADAVKRAHDRAVAETLAVLEAEAARARRGRDGKVLHDVDGLIGAAFRHRSSRAGDPQLHTHVITANLVRSVEDGRWSGLDSRGLYDLVAAGSALYQSTLRAELAPLGLRWMVRRYGLGEVADVDPDLLRAFSTQRRRIQDELVRTGHSSAAAAQVAAYRVRPAKDGALASAGDDQLRARWAAQLAQIRIGRRAARVADVTGCLGRERGEPSSRAEEGEVVAVLSGIRPAPEAQRRPCRLLTERASTLTRAQVIRAVATAIDQSPARVREVVERLLGQPEVVPLLAAAGSGSRPERRRYSTADLLAIEEALAERAMARRGGGYGRVTDAAISAAEAARPELSAEQRRVLRRLLSSGDGVEVVVGAGGTGKTFLLDAARAAWELAGYRVQGAALAALAAAQLEEGSGIPAMTVHRMLGDLGHPESEGLSDRDIIVVDESGMVGSRTLAAIADLVQQAGGKLVLAGDYRQLPEIDAGGGFRLLAERLGASELRENRRQRAGWEREALAELREGSVPEAIAAYVDHGRVFVANDAEAACAAVIARWASLLDEGVDPSQVLLVAATRDAVARLGRAAHEHQLHSGRLGPRLAEVADGELRSGARVLLTRNHAGLGVRNGERGRAVSSGDQGLVVAIDGREAPVTLPRWYVAEHLRQGYSLTAHRAQGATVAYALTLIDDAWYRELGYSALSRAREATELYLARIDPDEGVDHQPTEPPPEPITALAGQLGHTRAEQAALASLPQPLGLSEPAAARALWDERDRLAARLDAAGDRAPLSSGEVRRQRQLDAQLAMLERRAGTQVRFERPAWAAGMLGPLPTSRAGEAAWLQAAGAIVEYRQRWLGDGPSDSDAALSSARLAHIRRVKAKVDALREVTWLTGAPQMTPHSMRVPEEEVHRPDRRGRDLG